MNNIIITIIMPLYNAARFLNSALDSIINQTFNDFELICIDDASDDDTRELIKEKMKVDNRIKLVINNQRKGAGESRNIGMKYAQGEYITFLDGDDIFDESMLEKAYERCKKDDLDLVIYEYEIVDSDNIYNKREHSLNSVHLEKYCKNVFNIFGASISAYISWINAPWNKLYRRDFLIKNNISFQNLNSSNDVYFVELSLLLANKIAFLEDARVMVYVREHNTPSRISNFRSPFCVYEAYFCLLKALKERDICDRRVEYAFSKAYNSIIIQFSSPKLPIEEKIKFYDFLRNKGISELLKIYGSDIVYEFDENVKQGFINIMNNDFESHWFNFECRFANYLVKEKLYALFQNEKKILLWGAGKQGQILINAIDNTAFDFADIVDKNGKIQGKTIAGHVILSPEDVVFDEYDLILISVKGKFDEIKAELKSKCIVIDAEALVEI